MIARDLCNQQGHVIVQRVGKSKITKLKAKADIIYPLVRLLKTYDIENRLSQLESQIAELKSLIFQSANGFASKSKKGTPESGFEPESEPRQGSRALSALALAPLTHNRPLNSQFFFRNE